MSQSGSDAVVHQINVVSPVNDKPDSYFVGKHNGSKVRRIAKRIHELASSADPEMREHVLNTATVKYNGIKMTLQQFLNAFAY